MGYYRKRLYAHTEQFSPQASIWLFQKVCHASVHVTSAPHTSDSRAKTNQFAEGKLVQVKTGTQSLNLLRFLMKLKIMNLIVVAQ